MPLTPEQEELEHLWKVEAMRADIGLKRTQTFWETPRNLAILLAAVAGVVGAAAGTLGYKLGAQPSPPVQSPNITVYVTPQPAPAPAPVHTP